jgi:hypothetical protein
MDWQVVGLYVGLCVTIGVELVHLCVDRRNRQEDQKEKRRQERREDARQFTDELGACMSKLAEIVQLQRSYSRARFWTDDAGHHHSQVFNLQPETDRAVQALFNANTEQTIAQKAIAYTLAANSLQDLLTELDGTGKLGSELGDLYIASVDIPAKCREHIPSESTQQYARFEDHCQALDKADDARARFVLKTKEYIGKWVEQHTPAPASAVPTKAAGAI